MKTLRTNPTEKPTLRRTISGAKKVALTGAIAIAAYLGYKHIPTRGVSVKKTSFGQVYGKEYIDDIVVADDVFSYTETVRDKGIAEHFTFDDSEIKVTSEGSATWGYTFDELMQKKILVEEDDTGKRVSFLELDAPDTLNIVMTMNSSNESTTNVVQNSINQLEKFFSRGESANHVEHALNDTTRRNGVYEEFTQYLHNNTEYVLSQTTMKLYNAFIRNSEVLGARSTEEFTVSYVIEGKGTYAFSVIQDNGEASVHLVSYTPLLKN